MSANAGTARQGGRETRRRRQAAVGGIQRIRCAFITTALESGAQLEHVQKAAGRHDQVVNFPDI